jgi:hypothetical protein
MEDENEPVHDVIVELEKPIDHGLATNLHEKLGCRGIEPGPQAGRWNDQYR